LLNNKHVIHKRTKLIALFMPESWFTALFNVQRQWLLTACCTVLYRQTDSQHKQVFATFVASKHCSRHTKCTQLQWRSGGPWHRGHTRLT